MGRIEELGRKGYRIIQDGAAFCFGTDAVILSSFVKLHKGENFIDLGCGNGIIAILLHARHGASGVGLEIQDNMADMARRSLLLNGIANIEIVTGDIKQAEIFPSASFDVLVTNPPYLKADGLTSPNMSKAIARSELLCNLDDVLRAAAWLLKPKGRAYMVHRPHRLSDIFVGMAMHGLAPKELRMVHAHIDKPPCNVLIMAQKGGRGFLKVLPPLIIYDEHGGYTDELKGIYYG